jgi:dihydroxyacetone kinase-like protein
MEASMNTVCNSSSLIQTLHAMADQIISRKEYLTDLDSPIGDADHGTNLSRGFAAVKTKIAGMEGQCAGTILKTVGMTLVSTVGGASGPLFGTAFLEAGTAAMGKNELTAEDIAALFGAALGGVVKRGHAAVGDKTMVDTLAPVVDYLRTADLEQPTWTAVLARVAAIARQGMESTRPLMALKGRASFLKERSVGHLDPGAVSCYLLIKTMADPARTGGHG